MANRIDATYLETEQRPKENTPEAIACDVLSNLFCNQAKFAAVATRNDYYLALAYTVRERLMHRWIRSARTYFQKESRTVVYLSAEYLLGPQLGKNLLCLDMMDQTRKAMASLGVDLDDLLAHEEEPGLGNGGLGRLAACFLDSLAALQIPAIGYGIRYEFGIFDQAIRDGWQVEMTDKWLRLGNPWEVSHPEIQYQVKLGGRTEHVVDESGRYTVRWHPDRVVMGSPSDMPILGYGVKNANMLRLWRAEACESFDLTAFNVGDYYKAVNEKVVSENITKVLYPNDEPEAGRKLRLEQQYFFVSCSLQDMLRIYFQREKTLDHLARKYAVQLNDTHPALAVAEMMRLLVDEYRFEWERAWEVTNQIFSYTNHTLLPEALEKWPLSLFGKILPRPLEIIYEINRRFLNTVSATFPDDGPKLARLSLIEEGPEKMVRMANLACVGSHAINGVAQLHSELLKQTVLKDFYDLWPKKFSNKTNGVTPRRFVLLANPGLSQLITSAVGKGWVRDLDKLAGLESLARDPAFQKKWRAVKGDCKAVLADILAKATGVRPDPSFLFDVQAKRFHEYKRQHLNVLNIITLYNRLKRGMARTPVPRAFLFGGKAAPGYYLAKLIIRLIHGVAEVVNHDPAVSGLLSVAFIPDFNVKVGQNVYPAADLSEQISTAGKEASGTGNMKFALNGALTIGTLDGANIEIRERVGAENFFLFGLTADEVQETRARGYNPAEVARSNPELAEVLDMIASGLFSRGDRELFRPLVRSLLDWDEYLVLADYASYVKTQQKVSETYLDKDGWTAMSITNVARMGYFSSDRAIAEYCKDIWRVKAVPVAM
ncbi:MAG: glycogen/starch/alpha-glucan phosphorylase [Thermodesulfobacteriota bacterium]